MANILLRANALTRKHGLRAADGIQLACCLVGRISAPALDYVFLASDQELNVAARAEGIKVLDPSIP